SELYGRRIRVEMAAGSVTPNAPAALAMPSAPAIGSTEQPEPAAASVNNVAEASVEQSTVTSSPSAGAHATQAPPDARQKLYADSLVRRIFDEFDARLVDFKTTSIRPADPSAPKK